MHDPRVVRGNTYRQQSFPAQAQADPIDLQRQQEEVRRRRARQRAAEKARGTEVAPLAGRTHIEVQTELYLEELTDRVEEADVAAQTDPFLDRPPSPLFIPAKTGTDVATQIEDGELFDFDLEVKPILEVLVGKTCEQALMEVMEEEELDRLRDHQREYEELRNAELVETQRLEEQARRRREEKERRLRQQAEVARQERETADKIAARAFAQSYLSGLVPSVFTALDDGGYFFDEQEREVEQVFLPWLMDGVDEQLSQYSRARELLDLLITDVVAARTAKYGPLVEPEAVEGEEAFPNDSEGSKTNEAEGAPAVVTITEAEAEAAFKEMDVDSSGSIGVEEIQKIEEKFGLPLDISAGSAAWADGKVSLDEFKEMLKLNGNIKSADLDSGDGSIETSDAAEDGNAIPESGDNVEAVEAVEADAQVTAPEDVKAESSTPDEAAK